MYLVFVSTEITPNNNEAVTARSVLAVCNYCKAYDSLVFRLDALALSVIATATWLAGWVSVTAGIVSK